MRFSRFIPALLITMFSLTAHANDQEGMTATVGIGNMTFDSDRNFDDTAYGNIGLGYRFATPWAVELSYINADTETENRGVDADVTHWRMDALYHWEVINKIEPFLAFGVGSVDIDAGPNDKQQTMLNAGLGAKYWFRTNTALRGDVRFFRSSDDSDIDTGIAVSLHHRFGEAKASAPKQAAAPLDSDRDGVNDDADACPSTPQEANVDSRGCPTDSDRDGVADYMDACPDTTQRGAKIDAKGCYEMLKETVSVELNVEFDFDSANARPDHRAEVKRVFDFMTAYPKTKVTIEGHTDDRGNAEYNKDLSQRRADTIAEMLTNDFNLPGNRVSAMGYGEERPIASNDTDAGRQQNRRVVGVVEANVEKIRQE